MFLLVPAFAALVCVVCFRDMMVTPNIYHVVYGGAALVCIAYFMLAVQSASKR